MIHRSFIHRVLVVAALSLLMTTMLSAQSAATETASKEQPSQVGDFKLLWQRNIFSSTRQKVVERPPTETQSVIVTPPHDPATDWVLRGTLYRDRAWVALLENSKTGEALTASVGQVVAERTLTGITFDGVGLADGGSIAPGQTLTGGVAGTSGSTGTSPTTSGGSASMATSTNPDATSDTPSDTPPADTSGGGGGGMSMLERLRQRRAQESGAKP